MKSLESYIKEHRIVESGSQFKHTLNVSMDTFKKWKKENEKKYDIVYSEGDKLYTIYTVKDKSNPVWKGEHIGTYNCLTGDLYCDDKNIFNVK